MSQNCSYRVLLRFAKHGDLRLVSHHDLLRLLERLLRRAELPLARTQGFNPRPRIAFPLALALGIEGQRELLELVLTSPLDPETVRLRLAAVSPPGLDFIEAESLPPGPSTQVDTVEYTLDVPPDRQAAAAAAIQNLLASPSLPYLRLRPDRSRSIDLRPFLVDATLDPAGTLRFRLLITPEGSARPEEIVDALGLRDRLHAGAVLVRSQVVVRPRPASPGSTGPGPQIEAAPPDLPDSNGPLPERLFA
jgi:radical SAM-linked protein